MDPINVWFTNNFVLHVQRLKIWIFTAKLKLKLDTWTTTKNYTLAAENHDDIDLAIHFQITKKDLRQFW